MKRVRGGSNPSLRSLIGVQTNQITLPRPDLLNGQSGNWVMAVQSRVSSRRTLIILGERACRRPRAHLRVQLGQSGNALRLTQ